MNLPSISLSSGAQSPVVVDPQRLVGLAEPARGFSQELTHVKNLAHYRAHTLLPHDSRLIFRQPARDVLDAAESFTKTYRKMVHSASAAGVPTRAIRHVQKRSDALQRALITLVAYVGDSDLPMSRNIRHLTQNAWRVNQILRDALDKPPSYEVALETPPSLPVALDKPPSYRRAMEKPPSHEIALENPPSYEVALANRRAAAADMGRP